MVDELAPDTNKKIQALCKKISVVHNLDAEIQEECPANTCQSPQAKVRVRSTY